MAIYEIFDNSLVQVTPTTFASQGIKEREDLQRLIRAQIDVIAPGTLVVAEEFGEWDSSRRRIDLLAIDHDANIVVIELKRTEDGGHMELQAIRYAAMVANLTFNRVVEIYEDYLASVDQVIDAEQSLLDFLGWEDSESDTFASEVKIVLASAEFSKEITCSVLWLNGQGLDIKCVRLRPYNDSGRTLLDIQTIIPLPEAEQYQVQVRDKRIQEKISRSSGRDYSKFWLKIGTESHSNLPKRKLVLHLVKYLVGCGMSPKEIGDHSKKGFQRLFAEFEGELSGELLKERLNGEGAQKGQRFFCGEDEIIHRDGNTYAITNQWGRSTVSHISQWREAFPDIEFDFGVE